MSDFLRLSAKPYLSVEELEIYWGGKYGLEKNEMDFAINTKSIKCILLENEIEDVHGDMIIHGDTNIQKIRNSYYKSNNYFITIDGFFNGKTKYHDGADYDEDFYYEYYYKYRHQDGHVLDVSYAHDVCDISSVPDDYYDYVYDCFDVASKCRRSSTLPNTQVFVSKEQRERYESENLKGLEISQQKMIDSSKKGMKGVPIEGLYDALGVMAILLSETSPSLKYGDKPNFSQIKEKIKEKMEPKNMNILGDCKIENIDKALSDAYKQLMRKAKIL